MRQIPRYKRDKYIFISNLKNITANPDHPITLKRDGYLLSEQFSTATMVELAHWVKKKRNLLVSDNGNFTRMKAIASSFDEAGESLLNLALDEVKTQGQVTQVTLDAREVLFEEIVTACKNSSEMLDLGSVIERQLEINPDYLIGLEDFTIPVLMMCGLMHPVFDPAPESVKTFQKKTARLFSDQALGEFGHMQGLSKTSKFLVLHAYDYSSAFQGANQLHSVDAEGVAISYGGPMRSKRWITSLRFGDTIESFDEKLPEPYLISTALTMGAANGLRSDMPMHILGVGSPILIALIGQLLHRSRGVSIDSTAPFKDSNVGTLYGSRAAFLKMDMYKVAAHGLIENKPFSSITPYFKRFENDFPSNWLSLRSELGVTSATDVKDLAKQLKSAPILVEKYIPFFSRMRSGDNAMIKQLRIDRAGHNFWILRNICVSVRKRMSDHGKIEKWMQYQVNRYKSVASKKWSKAVEVAFELSKKHID
ncbi:MAG: hypothetical protein ACI8PB_005275 [Desulforhopalus sp.]|jgi:hypothetical protein